ncbi:MAG: AAA domain-containing protein [Candidatus Dadabacteria bacterium]|nr:AAA domain-containing protein [Candidatus Dadabacteria bacterium]
MPEKTLTLEETKTNAERFLTYISELANLGRQPITNIETRADYIKYRNQINNLPGIEENKIVEDERAWLTIKRLEKKLPPQCLDSYLIKWIKMDNDPNKKPEHRDEYTDIVSDEERIELTNRGLIRTENIKQIDSHNRYEVKFLWDDDPNLSEQFSRYTKEEWEPWAESEKPRRDSIAIYNKLHDFYRIIEGMNETDHPIELVFGLGIVKKYTNNAPECILPVVEQLAEIKLDSKTSLLSLYPRLTKPTIGLDRFQNYQEIDKIEKALERTYNDENAEFAPWDSSTYSGIVQTAKTYLDSNARIANDEADSATDKPHELTFYNDYCFFVRQRDEGRIAGEVARKFAQTIKNAKTASELPSILTTMVGGIIKPEIEKESLAEWKESSLQFPLPYNKEQEEIIKKLERKSCTGVAVQGPPGTGKTHTIANIICHYLALGRKVLVTSHSAPALAVLRDKLPPEIQPFAVPVLGSDVNSKIDIENALNQLFDIYGRNKNELEDIKGLEKIVENYRKEKYHLKNKIKSISETLSPPKHLCDEIDNNSAYNDAESLAIWFVKNKDKFSWFQDKLPVEANGSINFTNEDIDQLRETMDLVGTDLQYLGKQLPKTSDLPSIDEISDWHKQIKKAFEIGNEIEAGKIPHMSFQSNDAETTANLLQKKIEDIIHQQSIINSSTDFIDKLLLNRKAKKAKEKINQISKEIEEKTSIFFPTENYDATWIVQDNNTESLLHYIKENLKKRKLEQAEAKRKRIVDSLSTIESEITKQLCDFLNDIGNNIKLHQWQELFSQLEDIHNKKPQLDIIDKITSQIENSGAEKWANDLRKSHDMVIQRNWRDAWRWSCVNTYLDSIDSANFKELTEKFTGTCKQLETSIGKLVTARVIHSLKEAINDKIATNLINFQTALSKMPKGERAITRPFIRRQANIALQNCYEAIPCWVMPWHRANEILPDKLGAFDLVVVDEASQSGIVESISLLRGKKVLIVGDDKQVSPTLMIRAEEWENLFNRHIRDFNLPISGALTHTSSLFDIARSLFAGHFVMLREHFRCVEPIIAFSSRCFYNDEIQPLRVPTSKERILPPLVRVYVPNGYRDEQKCNKLETKGIVEEIQRITNNPLMQERSIGIASLLGNEQARFIEMEIRRTIPEDKINSHKIECGSAAHFQGKERDIMFLSMVSSPDSVRALTADTFKQRFNVATSRARDRLYLFHSIDIEQLHNKDDMRQRLLTHFEEPLQNTKNVQYAEELCESNFEKEFFRLLKQKGYYVTPQVGSKGYRIDLVVENKDGKRLAIELDGDRYHQDWEKDFHRQQVLERVGWVFWRCFASTYRRNPDGVFQDLLNKLQTMGIEPWEQDSGTDNNHTEVREFSPLEDDYVEEDNSTKQKDLFTQSLADNK